MFIVKLILGLTFLSFLSGCQLYAAPENIENLKSDIKQFKNYLQLTPGPNQCGPPGVSQGRICYYRLKVQAIEGEPNLYRGHVPYKVVERSYNDCQKDKPKFPDKDFQCQMPEYYPYVWFGFKVHGKAPDLNRENDFINIPWTNALRLADPSEADVDIKELKAMKP